MKIFYWALAAAVLTAIWESIPESPPKKRREPVTTEEIDGVTITRSDLGNGQELLRFRGGFDDVMGILDPSRRTEKPPLPDDLDIHSLKEYNGGCPHCRQRSFLGEGMWRYRVLSCTRERWDNTTTYLARCKGCQGLMKATVDHND